MNSSLVQWSDECISSVDEVVQCVSQLGSVLVPSMHWVRGGCSKCSGVVEQVVLCYISRVSSALGWWGMYSISSVESVVLYL